MSEFPSHNDKVVPIGTEQRRPDSRSLARLPAEMHQVREKARHHLHAMLRGLFDKTDDALFELADQATNNHDQNLYFDSMRQVRLRRRETEEGFFRQLDKAFARLLHASEVQPESADEPELDNLSLVGNDELEEMVASDTMINRANEQFAERLQHLILRMNQLVPVKIYGKNNPLGCESICHSFVDMAGKIDIDVKARLVLYKLFDKYVMTHLGELYDALNQLLIEANILPSLPGAQRRQPRPTSSKTAGAGRRQNQEILAEESGEAEQLLGTLRELLNRATSSDGTDLPLASGGATEAGTSTGKAVSSQELMGLLTQAQQQTPVTGTSAASVQDVKALVTQLLGYPGGSSRFNQMDEDVINLVSMMFEFILEDRNLAAPMKAQLARLQIPMIKVAIADKSFFGKGGHPARRLLNEMATAALGWQDSGDQVREKDALYQKIDTTVERVLNEFAHDIDVFETLLLEFRAFQEKEKRRARILEQRTIDAEDGKAKSERARAQVNAALTAVTQDRVVPVAAAKLLADAWANVLFITCLKQGVDSEDWQQQLATAEDLVWSATVEMTAENRQKLLNMVPSLLSRLRKGLEEIAFNPYEMGQLFKALEQLHIDILRGKSKPDPAAAAETSAVVIQPEPASDTPISATPASTESANVAPSNIEPTSAAPGEIAAPEAGNQSISAPEAEIEAKVVESQAAIASRELDEQHLSLVDNLTQGSWFEMAPSSGERYRCRLAAIIRATGKYIFVNRGGMKVAEETRETLALAIKHGRLRILDDGMLFDRALESVISNLKASRQVAR